MNDQVRAPQCDEEHIDDRPNAEKERRCVLGLLTLLRGPCMLTFTY